ncbi:MAG: hypothetical protein AAF328_03260 [Planctomycetota bacterium]
MIDPKRLGRWRCLGLTAGLSLATLTGCEATPDIQQDGGDGPTASNTSGLATDDPASSKPSIDMAGDGVTDETAAPEGTKAVAFVTLVDLPLDVSLEPAWSVVDEDVFPAITSGVWRSNGLRIGLLPRDRLVDFLNALPPNWGDRRQRIWGGDEPRALVRSRPIRAEFFVDLTVPPFAPQRETFRGNTATLLMKLRPQRGGFTRVTLTPQHHKPRQTIRPRTPQEKLLDGRIFEELSVTVAVPEQKDSARYLVLGLARTARTLPLDQRDLPMPGEAEPEEPAFESEEVSPTTEPGVATRESGLDLVLQADVGLPEPAEDEEGLTDGLNDVIDRRVDPLPLNLGRALMTTGMRGGEAQVLMMIEVRGLRE